MIVERKDLIGLVGDISPQMIQILKKECDEAINSTVIKEILTEKNANIPNLKTEDAEVQDIAMLITTELIEVSV